MSPVQFHHLLSLVEGSININITFTGSVKSQSFHIGKATISKIFAQPAITCLKLTIEILEQGVKYVQI